MVSYSYSIAIIWMKFLMPGKRRVNNLIGEIHSHRNVNNDKWLKTRKWKKVTHYVNIIYAVCRWINVLLAELNLWSLVPGFLLVDAAFLVTNSYLVPCIPLPCLNWLPCQITTACYKTCNTYKYLTSASDALGYQPTCCEDEATGPPHASESVSDSDLSHIFDVARYYCVKYYFLFHVDTHFMYMCMIHNWCKYWTMKLYPVS